MGRHVVRVEEGNFAFFVATNAPFLVGKIVAERVVEEGESEVEIHWLRPAKDHTLYNAASMTLDEYAKGAFVECYVMTKANGVGRGTKPKRAKDVSWEPVKCIIATSENLIGNGRKIPNRVLKLLRTALIGDRDTVCST